MYKPIKSNSINKGFMVSNKDIYYQANELQCFNILDNHSIIVDE